MVHTITHLAYNSVHFLPVSTHIEHSYIFNGRIFNIATYYISLTNLLLVFALNHKTGLNALPGLQESAALIQFTWKVGQNASNVDHDEGDQVAVELDKK